MRKFGFVILSFGMLMMGSCLASADLTGSKWGLAERPGIYVEFLSDSRVSGYGGCNRFSGAYERSGNTISFGPLASTKRACADELMQSEFRFFQALGATTSFHIDSDTGAMIHKSANDAELMRLIRSN